MGMARVTHLGGVGHLGWVVHQDGVGHLVHQVLAPIEDLVPLELQGLHQGLVEHQEDK